MSNKKKDLENNKVVELVSTNNLDRNLFTIIGNTIEEEENLDPYVHKSRSKEAKEEKTTG